MKLVRRTIIFVLTSSLILMVSHHAGTAIGQQRQLQSAVSNTLTAKFLNRHPLDQGTNRDSAVVNNHLSNIGSQHQQQQQTNNGLRNIMINQQKTTTGNDYMKAVNQQLLDLRQAFIERSFKFDEHFRNLLSASKRSLHKMFTSTYGVMYEKNTEIFTEMYGSLEQYYDSGQVNLTKSMDEFFANLYKRVFQVFHAHRPFTSEYLDCVSERLQEMKPFKEVPDNLIKSLKFTFVAARTFLKALNEGIDVIKNVISLGQSAQCTNMINDKLIKNQQALAKQPPCSSFCEQVMSRCIGKDNLDQMNENWRAYVESLSELALPLSTKYTFEQIIEPLDVQISEAIMNFQENAPNITERVFKICGHTNSHELSLGQSHGSIPNSANRQLTNSRLSANRLARRSANPIDYHQGRTRGQQQSLSPAQRQGGTLSEHRYKVTGFENLAQELSHRLIEPIGRTEHKSSILIDEIRKFLSTSKVFWSSLPASICAGVLSSNTSLITSGSAAPLNYRKQPSNCFSEQFSFTDINLDIRYKAEISKQARHLGDVSIKINKALKGEEVDWTGHEQQQQQQKPTAVSNNIQPMGGGSRPAAPIPSQSTVASPVIDPKIDNDDENIEDLEDSMENNDTGSGCEECSEEDPECCEPEPDPELTPGGPDPYPDTTESPAVDPIGPTKSEETSTTIDPEGNRIDSPPFITAQNEAGYQKSGQASCYKLVINSGGYIMLSSIMSVALLFVTNFSTRTVSLRTTR